MASSSSRVETCQIERFYESTPCGSVGNFFAPGWQNLRLKNGPTLRKRKFRSNFVAASGVSSGVSHVKCSDSRPPPGQRRGWRRFDRIHGASGRPARCCHCSDRQRRGLGRRPVVVSVQGSARRYLLIAGGTGFGDQPPRSPSTLL